MPRNDVRSFAQYCLEQPPSQPRRSRRTSVPYSLLHDGAVIVRGDDIVAAGVILPLAHFPVTDRTLGTRHRAALGLSEETSEETDALVAVAEETGTVSVAHRGRLQRGVTPDDLRHILNAGQLPPAPVTAPRIG